MQPDESLSTSAKWSRLFLRVFIPLAVLALLASLWLWHNEREQALVSLAERTQLQLVGSQHEIGNSLTNAAIDLMLLAHDPALEQLAHQPADTWHEHADRFLGLLTYKPVYERLRLVDMQGKERLRVDLNRGDPFVVPDTQLRDNHELPYFRDGIGLSRDRIYLSALDLHVDKGALERPFKPTLRLATPLYDKEGVKRGLLAINLVANQLLQRLQQDAPTGSELALLDADGQWLVGGQAEDNFGLITHAGKTLAERRPDLWKRMQADGDGYLLDSSGMWSYRKVQRSDPGTQADFAKLRLPFATSTGPQEWWLLVHHDPDRLTTILAEAIRLSLLFGGGALALALVVSILLATQATRGVARHAREGIFFSLLEQAPLGVMALDAAGEAHFFNANWVALTGFAAELAQGQGWWSLLDQPDQRRMQDALSTLAQNGSPPKLEIQLRLPDGCRRWVIAILSLPHPFMRKSVSAMISLADIQASKDHEARLASALQLVQGVVAGSGDPILAVDRHLRVTLVNPSLGQVFGSLYRDAPIAGDQLFDWMARFPLDQANLLMQFAHALQGKTVQMRLSLGAMRRLFDASFAPLCDEQGELVGAILFARDVTDMARIQARVARSEELFRAVFSGSLDAVFVMEAVKDEAGQIIDFSYIEANQTALNAVSATREGFIGKLQSELFPMTRERGTFDRYVRTMLQGEPYAEEVYMDYRGMQPGWYENRVVPLGWGITLTCRNITARRQAQMALATSEALQRNIFDSSPYAIIATDQEGLISLFNKAAEQMLGYRAAELVGRHTPALFHDNTELVRFALELSEQHGRTIEPTMQMFMLAVEDGPMIREWTYHHRDGQRIPVRLTLSARLDANGKQSGNMGIAFDISEQRQLEEERDRLHAVVEALPDMVAMSDLHEQLIYLNQAGRRLLGLAEDAPLAGSRISQGLVDWSYQLISRVGLPQAMAGRPWSGDTQMLLPNGQILDTRQLIVAPRMGGKEPSFTATIVHDLSEMRAMEAKMVEEDALLNSILESVQDAIVVVNESALVQSLNPAVADLFGYGLHKVMGQPADMLLPPELAAKYRQAFEHYMATGEHSGRVIGQRREVMGRRQDGTDFPLEMTMTEIKLGSKRLFTWVMRDISERKAFEERLLENIDELQSTQEALNAANEQLMVANMELGRMAQQDGLTGVANRRAFDQRLAAEWGRAARGAIPLTLLMIDVDHFKKFNDGYGHQMGDECLRKVSAVLRESVTRTSDFVARYGGEEFTILLPGTDSAGGREVAEHIRRRLVEIAIAHAFSSTQPYVTASIGIASMVPLAGVDSDYLVTAADQALYRAKAAGRDRAEVAGA